MKHIFSMLFLVGSFLLSSFSCFSMELMELDNTQDNRAQASQLCVFIGQNNHKAVEAMVTQFPQLVNTFGRHQNFNCDVFSLHIAAEYGHAKCARILLGRGADPNKVTKSAYAPLHWVRTEKVARLLLDAGGHVDIKNNLNWTPLWQAFLGHPAPQVDKIKQSKEIASLLLARGADINAPNQNGDTMLHVAATISSVEMVSFLLEHNADSTKLDKEHRRPAQLALKYHHAHDDYEKVFNVFERHGIACFPKLSPIRLFNFPSGKDILEKGSVYRAFLHTWARLFAAAKGSPQNAHEGFTTKIFGQDTYGLTVSNISEKDLYTACPEADLIKKVLKRKSKKAIKLVEHNDSDALEKHLQKYPWVVTYDAKRVAFLLIGAIQDKEKINCLRVLLINKIDIADICRRRGWDTTVLHFAVECKNSQALQLLIAHGVDCLQPNANGKTAMQCSIAKCTVILNKALCQQFYREFHRGDYKRCKLLFAGVLDCDASVRAQHDTLLWCMAESGKAQAKKFIPLLIAKGADVNKTDLEGASILWRLLRCAEKENQRIDIFKMLLKAGAKINARNKFKDSLLGIALSRDLFELADLFLDYGAIVDNSMGIFSGSISEELMNRLKLIYSKQECCICCEHPDDLDNISCKNKHEEFLCATCFKSMKLCPLCREQFEVKN